MNWAALLVFLAGMVTGVMLTDLTPAPGACDYAPLIEQREVEPAPMPIAPMIERLRIRT